MTARLRRRPEAGQLYPALAAFDVLLAATGRDTARRLTKPVLMPTLLGQKRRPVQRALALSGLGDVALLCDSDTAFSVGLGAFLASHLAWVRALRPASTGVVRRHPLLLAPYAMAWLGLNTYLWPRTGKDRLAVLAYSAALLATALAAADTGEAQVAAGGVLFLASDTLLALNRFAGVELPRHEGFVMATYTTAQALLARG